VNVSPKAVTQTLYRKLQETRTPFYENVLTEGVELWSRRESEKTIIADAEKFMARMERYLRRWGQ
jgi:membrane glycosyltransferase